jgi:hypothetical protein
LIDRTKPFVGKFNLALAPRTELKDEILDGFGRVYTVPSGERYPSVTTIIGKATDMSWKDEWVARVGEDKAREVTQKALDRGNTLHALCEDYLKGVPVERSRVPQAVQPLFRGIRDTLLKSVDKIYGIEYPLYSGTLNTAGRADLIGVYEGCRAVVDFKGSNRPKSRDDIPGYFIQAACYAMMFEECFPINIPKLVVIMAVENTMQPIVFKEETSSWRNEVHRIFQFQRPLLNF